MSTGVFFALNKKSLDFIEKNKQAKIARKFLKKTNN